MYTFTPKYNSINGQKDLLQVINVAAVTDTSLATDPNKRCVLANALPSKQNETLLDDREGVDFRDNNDWSLWCAPHYM